MAVAWRRLNDGRSIPEIGAGTWPVSDDDAPAVVRAALDAGYRHIDTAAAYGNEHGVGTGLATSGVPREDVFLTTKIANADHGRRPTVRALESSLRRLRTDYVDLALIHWPLPDLGLYPETWNALIELRAAGKVRSIGVSNFRRDHLDRLIGSSGVTPAVNQIEINPVVQHRELRRASLERGVAVEAWSPLGPKTDLLADPHVTDIARRHGKTAAQVVLRWHLQRELIAIPKSSSPRRLRENIDLYDFVLDGSELDALDQLDRGSPARYTPHLAGDSS